jgi:hypothetical protein
MKYLLVVLLFLGGCTENPEMKKELLDFSEARCKDFCITHSFTSMLCSDCCEARGWYKTQLEVETTAGTRD